MAANKWGEARHVFTEALERTVEGSAWRYPNLSLAGLQQTATGYGEKLSTDWMVRHNGRDKRVYCVCHSNIGTLFIISKGKQEIVDIY